MSTTTPPRCPMCGRKGEAAGQLWRCKIHGFYDDDSDEGGTYSDRNAGVRIEREERRQERRRVR